MRCGTAMVCMPSCTTPTFSKMPATSQETQPAAVVICQASGKAIAKTPTSSWFACHSHSPIAEVATSNRALSIHRLQMNCVTSRMWRAMAVLWSSTTSCT